MLARRVGAAIAGAAIVAATAVALVVINSSSGSAAHPAPSTAPAAAAVARPYGCHTSATGPNVVEMCGDCRVIETPDNATRDRILDALAAGVGHSGREVWMAVGDRWIAGDDSTSYAAAVECANRFGGYVQRFTG